MVNIIVKMDINVFLLFKDLLKMKEGYEKRRDVPYIIYNDGSSRSNDCWRDRNML